jgi:mannose-6-phosphate isomerase-like protein (cupin superfamily)
MPVIHPEQAPTFDAGGATITGLAAPSRGATDTAAWRVRFSGGHASPPHSLDREEVFVVLSGAVTARYADHSETAHAGGALIVPAGVEFSVCADGGPAEAVCTLPAGGTALLAGDRIVPPWAV